MTEFKKGDLANMASNNGEIEVEIIELVKDGTIAKVQTTGGGYRVFNVESNSLRRLRGPFFDTRGLVFTTNIAHQGEQGEIIKVGNGPNAQLFYKVRFEDESESWLNEDEVFIERHPLIRVYPYSVVSPRIHNDSSIPEPKWEFGHTRIT